MIHIFLILYTSCIEYDLKDVDSDSLPEPEEVSSIVEPVLPPDCEVEEQTTENVEIDQECETEEYSIENPWNVEIEWQWNGLASNPYINQVMVAPIVGNLNDDDGDGLVTELDTPDIVIVAFDSRDGNA